MMQMLPKEQLMSDAEAIVRARSEPSAFRAVFDRHFAAIHRYLNRRLGEATADDLAAETFAIAFHRRDSYDVSWPNARPWLYGIAANLIRHHARAERRRLLAYARSAEPSWSEAETEAVDERIDAQRLGPMLAVALASLRPGEREVLLLFAWEGLPYAGIAIAIGIPEGTVRSRLNRARKKVRELLPDIGQLADEDNPSGDDDG
jgi:RNA polymerase sigma factor (sigma-70 family)